MGDPCILLAIFAAFDILKTSAVGPSTKPSGGLKISASPYSDWNLFKSCSHNPLQLDQKHVLSIELEHSQFGLGLPAEKE